ncbi:MAG TPA: hypothetical protein VK469_09470 [Candidatus Kapabacteria bacterium]|nr:hypothetical protein [Candidatus Kapabacteria bacterium]
MPLETSASKDRKASLKMALDALDCAVRNVTPRHVRTYTGKLEWNVERAGQSIGEQLNVAISSPDKKLAADSLYKFEGDYGNFVTNIPSILDESVLKIHQNTVKAGLDTLMELRKMFKGITK